MIMYDKVERIGKEVARTYFKVPFLHLFQRPEEKQP